MHWINYSLLVTTLWAANCRNSVALAESSNTTEESTIVVNPKENEIFLNPVVPDITEKPENRTGELNSDNATTSDEISLKSDQPREVENATFNDFKPFLLFPILPYLFPPREEENSLNSKRDESSALKNDTQKIEGSPPDVKPFIFFDFAFNIRRIPINNATDNLNDSKIINVKKLSISNAEDQNLDSLKNRKRRNTKIETPSFFDDAPLFPDSELDEFLPKPELFFPDLPFHHKPTKKLSRRKRDPKKTELKNDLKSFFDAFDEAFMRTKRELEWADPILNFLRGGEQSFEEEKKDADDLFSQLPVIQEKPTVKWRIQRNIKRLNNDHQIGSTKAKDGPTIIVDKVVKIGEFHVHDDLHDKSKKKKRGLMDSNRKFLARDAVTLNKDSQNIPKNIFELIKQEGTKRKKRMHPVLPNHEEESSKKTEPREIRNSSQINTSIQSSDGKHSEENDKKGMEEATASAINGTEKIASLMKIFDTLKGKMEQELKNVMRPPVGNLNTNYASLTAETEGRRNFQASLKKNLTEFLKQFQELNKDLEDLQSQGKPREKLKSFNWAEKETILNSNVPGKASRERRQKKEEGYFEDDDSGKKEKKVADLYSLFFNVTFPTLTVFGVVLVICFFIFQVKGKACANLFRPRQILIRNEEAAAHLRNPSCKKIQAI